MSTHAVTHSARSGRLPFAAVQQIRWLAGGLALGFFVPFVFADLLDIQRDLYLGIYVAAVLGFFVAWTRATDQSIREMVHRRWLLAVVLGIAFGALMALIVLRTEDATSRPGGLELAGALFWRGVVYGATDGLLLSAFPILAVFAAFAGTAFRRRWTGKIVIGAAAFAASIAMTSVYHLGYSDFRSSKVARPVAGDVAWSVPTLVTLNPIGAPIAHVGLHVTAVLHSSDTETFLPPHD